MANMKKHIDIVHNKLREYKCYSCDKAYDTKHTLNSHINQNHEKTKTYKCEMCDKSFFNNVCLYAHRITHNESTHKCDTCQKTFKCKKWLTDHIRMVHEKIRKYVCEFCKHAFTTKANLIRHQVNGWCSENQSLKDPSAKVFKCDLCEKSFLSNAELRQHCRIHQ